MAKVSWKSICHNTATAVSWTSTINVDGMVWKSSWPRYHGSQSATTAIAVSWTFTINVDGMVGKAHGSKGMMEVNLPRHGHCCIMDIDHQC
eukprot:g11373.t1